MATFEVQVEGLTGIAIDGSSSPTQDQLSEFLKDGVIDVTSKWLTINPIDYELFTRESAEQTSNGAEFNGARIASVLREGGTNNYWRRCIKISTEQQYDVIDENSLYFATKYQPVFMLGNKGDVSVFPTPAATTDAFKVYYINNDPVNKSNADLAYSHNGIGYFADDKVYLVVIYAGIKSLENAMAAKSIPTISGDGSSTPIELTDIDDLDTENTIDVHPDAGEIDQWWSTLGHLIEDEEDTELAEVQIQKIMAYMQAYERQLSGNTTDYQWMQSRHQILLQQYALAFGMSQKPAQRGGE